MSGNKRPTVADIRAMKARGQKISMLYVARIEEAEAADAAGVDSCPSKQLVLVLLAGLVTIIGLQRGLALYCVCAIVEMAIVLSRHVRKDRIDFSSIFILRCGQRRHLPP